jgi:arylsulfatase A-like enzyme
MIFTDAHTSSSVCTPTRYGILTGRYNWRSRLKSSVLSGKSKALIPSGRTTLASLLKQAGYHTAFIGKWHLGWDWAIRDPDRFNESDLEFGEFDIIDFSKPVSDGPGCLGFDYSYGHSGSLDMAPYVYVENGRVTSLPDRVTGNDDFYAFWRRGPTGKDFIHVEVTPNFFRHAMDYIRQQAGNDRPFFLYLALPSPHTPILPTPRWQGKSKLNAYGDFVMMIDDLTGQLLEVLENEGMKKNTLVFFTSDNGCSPRANFELLGELGHDPSHIFRGHKADIFEGGHRVPFIARWPSVIGSGTVCDETICTTDFFRTLATITGYTVRDDEGEDSYNLGPLFRQLPLQGPFREATVHHSITGDFAIRKGDWKLIMCPGSGGWSYPSPSDTGALDSLPPVQLYNLKDDPGETVNLQAVHPQKVSELRSLLTRYIQEGRSTPGIRQKNDSIGFEWHQIRFIRQE